MNMKMYKEWIHELASTGNSWTKTMIFVTEFLFKQSTRGYKDKREVRQWSYNYVLCF